MPPRRSERARTTCPPGQHGHLGSAAADVDDECTGSRQQVESGTGRRRDRLVDQLDDTARPQRLGGGRDGPALDVGCLDRQADHCRGLGEAPAHARLPQERLQHRNRSVEVRDHPVAERMDDLDVLRLLVAERVGGSADGYHAAGRMADRDCRRLLDDDAAPAT